MRDAKEYTILDAKAATGIGNIINVRDFRYAVITVNTASSANLTAKVQGAISETPPTFTSAAAVGNAWDYVQLKDLEDASTIDGDTGFAVAGTDDQRIFEVNVNGLEWLTMNVTARSAGSVTAVIKLFTD